jgi:hypothetical protein
MAGDGEVLRWRRQGAAPDAAGGRAQWCISGPCFRTLSLAANCRF